ncbi:oligosaccharide flippase family protein, partial [Alistipes ihumii]
RGGLSIAKLGFFIVVTTFASTATMYIVRSFVSQKIGTDGVGMFQAAWNISNVYTGLITSAMMADFFPRLSERSNDHAAMARLTNEQGEIALIIGAPMIAGILLFIPVVLNILYSSQFMAATAILQWQMAGAFTGFLSWPLSVIFLAKGKGHYCILTDGVWCAAYLCIVFAGWHRFGLEILGIAAICSSFAKLVLVYVLVRTRFRFRWSRRNLRLIGLYGGLIAGALLTVLLASGWVKYAIGGAIVLIVCCISYRHLNEIVAVSSLITKIRRRMGGKRP